MAPYFKLIHPLPPFHKLMPQSNMSRLRLWIEIININMNTFQDFWLQHRKCTAVFNDHLSLDFSSYISVLSYGITNVHSLYDTTENHVLVIESGDFHQREIKTRRIGIFFSAVTHGNKVGGVVFVFEMFIIEEFSID